MIKKEINDILKSTIFKFGMLLIFPLLFLSKVSLKIIYTLPFVHVYKITKTTPENAYLILFIFLLGIVIYLTVSGFGWGAFRYEYKDRAFEYLLSFPISRYRILFNKMIPRIYLLTGMVIIYEILAIIFIIPLRQIQSKLFFLFDPVFFPYCVCFIFLASFLMGLFEQKNWVAVLSFFSIIVTACLALFFRLILRSINAQWMGNFYEKGISFIVGSLIVLLILGISFFQVYKRFDVKNMNIHGKRFVLRVLPSMGILTTVSLVFLFS